jgi:hypothetical protein
MMNPACWDAFQAKYIDWVIRFGMIHPRAEGGCEPAEKQERADCSSAESLY